MASQHDAARQARLAKKKLKREGNNVQYLHLTKEQSEQVIRESLEEIGKFPIFQCLIPQALFVNGFGTTLIARKINDDEVIVGGFWLDVYCMGVRGAFLRAMQMHEYNSTINSLHRNENFGLAEPALVRALVEQSVEYGQNLGFKPHADYDEARYIFGDIDPKDCTDTFTFGKDGKPRFVAGPDDPPQRCLRIVERLTEKLGPDGFTYKLKEKK
ncbi:hypothetical protein [Methylomagnum sp.]